MSPDEVQEKLARLRAWMAEQDVGAVALGGQTHVAWLCGGLENLIERSIEAGLVRAFVTHDAAYLVTQNIEGPRLAAEESVAELGLELRTFPWWTGAWDEVMRSLAPAGERVVGDGHAIGEPRPSELRALRLALSPVEQERLRVLGADAAQTMESTLRQTASGDTERTVAARFVGALEAQRIHPVVVLVGGDTRRRRFRHPLISDAPITESAMCVLVGVRDGLNIALTRSITLGAPEEQLQANHERAAQVHAAMVAASRPGASYGDALQAGIEAYAAVGLPDEWREHYQGGGIGYHIRETGPAPLAEPNEDSAVLIEAGHAVAWNPTVQGAKSEDTFLVTPDGPELLTRTGDWPEHVVAADGVDLQMAGMLELGAGDPTKEAQHAGT